jgi:ATP-dependent Clp protease ATP-binding subunit ClpA
MVNKSLDPTQAGHRAETLNTDLRKRIIGQDDAIRQVVNMYQAYASGLSSPRRPIGTSLFLGPTGSGKTLLVEAMAESLVGHNRAVIKIDCAEFQHSHEIAKLIGSPPGYLGHRETHPLFSQEVLDSRLTESVKVNFVLFDEIEKASDALWNLLLGILDKATLTTGDNRLVDFSRAMIFMTSNLGAGEMNSIMAPRFGFASGTNTDPQAGHDELNGKLYRAAVEAARRKFTPEFMNRIDKTVVFKPLDGAALRQVLTLELNIVQERILTSLTRDAFVFSLTDDAKDYLLREGTDTKYGARHLKRAIDRHLVHALSNLIGSGQVAAGDLIEVDLDTAQSRLTFSRVADGLPPYAMAQMVDGSLARQSAPASSGVVGSRSRAMGSAHFADSRGPYRPRHK